MNAMKRIVVLTAVMLTLIVTASGQPASTRTATFKVEETLVGPVDADRKISTYSADGCHLAYIAKRGEKQCVVVDGQVGAEYEEISDRKLIFSPDGKRVAYEAWNGCPHLAATEWKGIPADFVGKCFVVVDGKASPEYTGSGTLAFSPDSKREAYVAEKGAKRFVVLDGQPGPEYDGIGELTFSPDSKRVAYVAEKGARRSVVVDGQPGPECDGIGKLTFSPDSKRLAYVAQKRGLRAVVDGQPGPAYDDIRCLFFSPDSKRVAYTAGKGGVWKSWKWSVVVDGQVGPEYDRLEADPTFTPDGKHVAYEAWKGKKRSVVIDGQPGAQELPLYARDHTDFSTYYNEGGISSPDGKRVAIRSKSGSGWVELVGKPGPDDDVIGDSREVVTDHGLQRVYPVQRGKSWHMSVDDQNGPSYQRIGWPVFSPDSRRVAYPAKNHGMWFVVVNGHEGDHYEEIAEGSLTFSPDSEHTVYSAKYGWKYFVVLDGQPGPAYDDVPKGQLTFHPDGVLEYVAIRDNSLYRVRYIPAPWIDGDRRGQIPLLARLLPLLPRTPAPERRCSTACLPLHLRDKPSQPQPPVPPPPDTLPVQTSHRSPPPSYHTLSRTGRSRGIR